MTPAALSALSLGYLFPAKERHVLQVHSVFQHALNLRSEEGRLLTLLCAEKYQNLADAARIMLPEQWDWRREAAGTGTILLADGVLVAPSFRVDLNAATVWHSPLQRNSLNTNTCLWSQRHYKTLDSQLLLFCLEYKIESALQWQGNILQQGLRPQELPEQLEDQVPRLIGYGKGLTPDGDDYLLGYLAALWQWKLPPGLEAHYVRLQRAIERQLPHTTDISQHYLHGALQGHFSQPICELLKQLNADAPTTTIIACTEQVMQFGATSGVDCLAGLLHGMRTLKAHH